MIEYGESDDMFHSRGVRLTSKVNSLFRLDANASVSPLSSDHFRVIAPGSIVEKRLLFGEKETRMLEKILSLLREEAFCDMRRKLGELGMKPGITIVFHGPPGTGKTETVHQLARSSGRYVLSADVSTIRSKWVGETEKNIRQVFSEYRKQYKQIGVMPILLFNEADSIMGRRRSVKNRVDQMDNAMQNILLEELEDFDGIFMATTNLTENMDDAFDRRMLYKIRFEEPDRKISLTIMKERLGYVDEQQLEELNSRYTLTGAQIENINKKLVLNRLLNAESEVDLGYLMELAEQELSFKRNAGGLREPIGFLRAS